MIDFKNIEYLKSGNARQQKAYEELTALNIFDTLKKYNPLLTGTIPIDIDIPESDLDIICQCRNHSKFSILLKELYSKQLNFKIKSTYCNTIECTVATFDTNHFKIEIFGQDIPTNQQNAYLHMFMQYQILTSKGKVFRDEIRRLKRKGIKTEPAFASLLGLKGNPYEALLKFKIE